MNIKYPVFALSEKDNLVYVFFKEKDLKTTNTALFKKNIFKNVILIDSSGNIYKIRKTYKVGYIGILGISLLKKGRQILVDFEFENDVMSIKIEDFKQDLIQKIEKNKGFWRSAWNINELKEGIINCNSFEEIADFIK